MNNVLTSSGLINFEIDELAIFFVLASPEKTQDTYSQVIKFVTIVDIALQGFKLSGTFQKRPAKISVLKNT